MSENNSHSFALLYSSKITFSPRDPKHVTLLTDTQNYFNTLKSYEEINSIGLKIQIFTVLRTIQLTVSWKNSCSH